MLDGTEIQPGTPIESLIAQRGVAELEIHPDAEPHNGDGHPFPDATLPTARSA